MEKLIITYLYILSIAIIGMVKEIKRIIKKIVLTYYNLDR